MEENKVVLLIAFYFPPAAGIGTFRITKFAKYLKKLGYIPVIVSPNRKHYANIDSTLLGDLDGIKRYELELSNSSNKLEKEFYYSLIKAIPTIYTETHFTKALITGGPFYYLKIVPLLNKKYGTKIIVDFRDPWSLQKTIDGNVYQRIKNIIYKRYAHFIEKRVFRYSSYVTVVNDTMKRDYSRVFKKHTNKIVCLPNAIDKDDYDNVKPYQFKDKTILYAGKFSTSSGFRDPTNFLIALKNINQTSNEIIKFVHVGINEQKILDKVKELECESFVEFYGNTSYKDTIAYCKGAEILLILSTKEKCEQTGKIYDYLGCKRKILAVTNKKNEIYKLCKKYNIFTANPDDIMDIENNIKNLLQGKNITYSEKIDTREIETKKLINLLNNMDNGDKND